MIFDDACVLQVAFCWCWSSSEEGLQGNHMHALYEIVHGTLRDFLANAPCIAHFGYTWSCSWYQGRELLKRAIMAWPQRGALCTAWDSHPLIREYTRANGKLLSWSSPATTGVGNYGNLRINRWVIQKILETWVTTATTPKAPTIGFFRHEAGHACSH